MGSRLRTHETNRCDGAVRPTLGNVKVRRHVEPACQPSAAAVVALETLNPCAKRASRGDRVRPVVGGLAAPAEVLSQQRRTAALRDQWAKLNNANALAARRRSGGARSVAYTNTIADPLERNRGEFLSSLVDDPCRERMSPHFLDRRRSLLRYFPKRASDASFCRLVGYSIYAPSFTAAQRPYPHRRGCG